MWPECSNWAHVQYFWSSCFLGTKSSCTSGFTVSMSYILNSLMTYTKCFSFLGRTDSWNWNGWNGFQWRECWAVWKSGMDYTCCGKDFDSVGHSLLIPSNTTTLGYLETSNLFKWEADEDYARLSPRCRLLASCSQHPASECFWYAGRTNEIACLKILHRFVKTSRK